MWAILSKYSTVSHNSLKTREKFVTGDKINRHPRNLKRSKLTCSSVCRCTTPLIVTKCFMDLGGKLLRRPSLVKYTQYVLYVTISKFWDILLCLSVQS